MKKHLKHPRKEFTWWMGWWCLLPIRIVSGVIAATLFSFYPPAWYGWLKAEECQDPACWNINKNTVDR